jgi:hypothetical protein
MDLRRAESGPSSRQLLLTLLSNLKFKSRSTLSYLRTYPSRLQDYTKGSGTRESAFGLAVQFLNRRSYVDLIEQHDGLKVFCDAIKTVMEGEGGKSYIKRSRQQPKLTQQQKHTKEWILRMRRYGVVISDFKCLLNVKTIPKKFIMQGIKPWIDTLKIISQNNKSVLRGRALPKTEVSFNI